MRERLLCCLLITVVSLWFAGCCNVDCGACPPPVTLLITTSDGIALEEVTIDGELSQECDPRDDGGLSCLHWGSNVAGTHTIEVGAVGYVSQTFDVVITDSESDGCCSCPFDDLDVEVVLEP